MKLLTLLLAGTTLLVGVGIGLAVCSNQVEVWEKKLETEKHRFFSQYLPHEEKIALVDPQMAPVAIKPQILEGLKLVNQTHVLLPQFVGANLSCSNCHIAGGNTLGGLNGGIPLVGVNKIYPTKMDNGSLFTLEDRINNCFMRSMNGRKIPVDSKEMLAIVAYLNWISSTIPEHISPDWLGEKQLPIEYHPDPQRGEDLYIANCAMCHGKDGDGQSRMYDLSYPPVWGKHSFNQSAGMNKLNQFASFIYYNMPYQNPDLTMEEALDIAAFVISQTRPKDE